METKVKVLIVDHRAKETESLKEALGRKAYGVVTAKNAADGMKKAEKECPDIIVLETKSQGQGNAIEVCHSYRKEDSKFRHIPILMTIERDDYIANSLFENPRWSPFEALENKPENVKELISSVENILNKTLKNTFIVLFGYYKEEKDAVALRMMHERRLTKKSA